jgi:hypothetical protein
MIVSRNLRFSHIVYYAWKPMLYFAALSIAVYVGHNVFDMHPLTLPFNAVATLSTALANTVSARSFQHSLFANKPRSASCSARCSKAVAVLRKSASERAAAFGDRRRVWCPVGQN